MPNLVSPPEPFFVGDVFVEPSLHRIRGADGPVAVEPKVMEVLLCLARRPGVVVPREALLAEVWAGTVVTDHVLTRAVSELRRALGDRSREPGLVETIPKAGYRLAAPVTYAGRGDTTADRHGGFPELAVPLPLAVAAPALAAAPPVRRRASIRRIATAACVVAGVAVAAFFAGRPASYRAQDLVPPSPGVTRPLTAYEGLELYPAFSPDGAQVAFVWHRTEDDSVDLYVKPVDAETPLRLTTRPGRESSPAWSPDGQHVVFARHEEAGCALYRVPALGGGEVPLGPCGPAFGGLAWSPDGRRLALSHAPSPGGAPALFVRDVDDAAEHRLTEPPAGTADQRPTFSPDGRSVAFIRSTSDEVMDLHVVSLDGGAPRRLTFDHAPLAGHAWTPDGRHLVFSSARDGLYRIWSVPAAGGTPGPYTPVSAWDPGGPAFALQGGRMAYVEWFYDVNVWRTPTSLPSSPALVDAARTTGPGAEDRPDDGGTRIAPSTRSEYHPTVAPDGDRLAFVSNRSGSSEVWVSGADGTGLVRLTSFRNAATSRPRWSPDGRRLTFTTRREGRADVYVVDAAGGRPLRLTGPPFDEANPTWSPDGRFVYFAVARAEGPAIWKVPAAGGTAVAVLDRGVEAFESPDGTALFFTRPDTSGVWRFDPSRGTTHRVVDAAVVYGSTPFEVTRTGLYVLRLEDGRPFVYRHAFDTGRTTRVAPLAATALTPEVSFAVSPDDAWIYYTRRDRIESDLMLVAPPP